jgi:cell division protein YceG involved in septum cleavage
VRWVQILNYVKQGGENNMFIIAIVEGTTVYNFHDKIYKTRANAEKALATMKKDHTLNERWEVCEIEGMIFKGR